MKQHSVTKEFFSNFSSKPCFLRTKSYTQMYQVPYKPFCIAVQTFKSADNSCNKSKYKKVDCTADIEVKSNVSSVGSRTKDLTLDTLDFTCYIGRF